MDCKKVKTGRTSTTSVCCTCKYLRERGKTLKTTDMFWLNVRVLQGIRQTGSYKGHTHTYEQLITGVFVLKRSRIGHRIPHAA